MATIIFKNVIFMMHNHSSLSLSTTHLSVSASYSDSYSSFKAFTIDYLTTKCGFSLKSAMATSRKLHVDQDNIKRSDAVLSLLKSHGFDESHIAKIIQRFPLILNHYRVDENLKLKLEYLVENGFSGPLLHELVVASPRILSRSLGDHIEPLLDFLRPFLGTEERLKLAVKRNPLLLTNNLEATLQPNVYLLLKEGVPLDSMRNFIISHPNLMQPKVDRLVSALQIVRDVLNMRPTDPSFLTAVLRIAAIGVPLWEKKLQLFNSFGFSQQEAFSIYKRYPQCFVISEEKIRSKLDFYFNTVELKNDHINTYPILLTYGIETRIRPRHNVLKLLASKKLLKEDASIANIFTISEAKFLNKYVTKHLQQVPSLLEMYNNVKVAVK